MQVTVAGPRDAAHGASLLWTLTASPLTATTGVAQTFTLTATNTDPLADIVSANEIGCVVVTLPTFSISAAVVTGSNAGGSWHVDSVTGSIVTVHADSGGDRLATLDWVIFTVTATAQSAGSPIWTARAFRQQDCSGSGAVLGVPPIVVVTGPSVTPSPAPTPPPTPVPTPTPSPTSSPTPNPTPTPSPRSTPTPSPAPTLPVPLPSLPLPSLPVPLPSLPLPLPTAVPDPPRTPDAPTATPRASAESPPASDDGSPGAAALPNGPQPPGTAGPGGTGSSGAGTATSAAPPTLRFEDLRLDLGSGVVGVLAGVEVWAVPAATIAVPGLLVLLWVALQAAGALAWIPAARRLKAEGGPRRRRRRRR